MSKPFDVKLKDGRNFRGLVQIAHMRKRFAINLGGAGVRDADWPAFFPSSGGAGLESSVTGDKSFGVISESSSGVMGVVTAPVIPAMLHCFREILDNCVDEYQKGLFCRNVQVSLLGPYAFSVLDDGRGVPPELFKVFMIAHAGSNFGDDEASRGQNGVGAKAVRAVSAKFVVTSKIGGETWRQSMTVGPALRKILAGLPGGLVNLFEESLDPKILIEAGLSKSAVSRAMEEDGCVPTRLPKGDDTIGTKSGSLIEVSLNPLLFSESQKRLLPDEGLLPEVGFFASCERVRDVPPLSPDLVEAICRETAMVCPKMRVEFENRNSGEAGLEGPSGGSKKLPKSYQYPGGIGWVASSLGRPFFKMTAAGSDGGSRNFEVEAFLVQGSEGISLSFVNGSGTRGGTHVDDLMTMVADEMRESARELKKLAKDVEVSREDVRGAVFLIVSVKMTSPSFSAQIKDVLTDTWIKPILKEMVAKSIPKIAKEAPGIIDAVASAARSRFDAKMNREAEKQVKKTAKQRPIKLVDANTSDRDKAILFLAEGNSAAAGFRGARDERIMGILPLKGVTMNCSKVPFHKAMKNDEIESIVSSMGLPLPSQKNPGTPLNFGKVVILTDADVDGGHIRSLLVTFFCEYWPWLAREGRLMRAIPPLYELMPQALASLEADERPAGSGWPKFASSDEEKDRLLKEFKKDKLVVFRNKGLGEMSPEAWSHTLTAKECMVRLDLDDGAFAAISKWSDKDAASAAGRRDGISAHRATIAGQAE
jgi:DNA gyrase/topoisomerase IV subunit B